VDYQRPVEKVYKDAVEQIFERYLDHHVIWPVSTWEEDLKRSVESCKKLGAEMSLDSTTSAAIIMRQFGYIRSERDEFRAYYHKLYPKPARKFLGFPF
jgi:hypothetical protein